MSEFKQDVHEFWNDASCGERLYLEGSGKAGYLMQMRKRYEMERYIESFAKYTEFGGLDLLDIGVELGADHQRFLKQAPG